MQLELNDRQAQIISQALDIFSRVQCGQLKYIADLFWGIPPERYLKIRQTLEDLEPEATGLNKNAYHGIHSKENPESARIAYDIHQVIRNHLACKSNLEGDTMCVAFDTPFKTSVEELPKIS